MMLLAVGGDDTGRSKDGEEGLVRPARQAGVEWRHGIAALPDGSERMDEARSAGEVQCDEFRHWPVA